ncbi:hypothetical protein EG850_08210 [Gulosibacter macacae]|uniref:Lipoprotein n=1 Tax=Gulosibacter macacae TaxID=2488791 RepID=A0A3P3VVB1_9MICO|nr:hypothetical protein [Gulosibacter macacae]RRJ86620.1 hypothetical protein EG850_08210 [Gulosibacter macacae]
MRKPLALLTAAAAAIALSGCATQLPFENKVNPWVVANHDEKVAYHAGAVSLLVNLDALAGIAALPAFQAVGYMHIETERNGKLNLEYVTSVDGESYVSRRVSNEPDDAYDQSHEAGSSVTYYLLGDNIKSQLSGGKRWVEVTFLGDLNRSVDASRICGLYSVTFMCALTNAWNISVDSGMNIPVQLSQGEAGDQHFATAVTYEALTDVYLIPKDGEFDGFLDDAARKTLIPLHFWVSEDGVVTKAEVNGVLTGADGQQLKLQVGFEITSREPSTEMVPVASSNVPNNDVYRITTQEQLDSFLSRLAAL